MPSRDATGKPLSGAAKRRKAAARGRAAAPPAGLLPPKKGPHPLQLPPTPGTIDQAVLWAAQVQSLAAALARRGLDPSRVRAISAVVGAMGKLRTYARDSEDAVVTLRHLRKVEVDVRAAEPPAESAGLCAWAFWQLVDLLGEVGTFDGEVDESIVSHQARALAQLNHVRPQPRLDEIAELLKEHEAES